MVKRLTLGAAALLLCTACLSSTSWAGPVTVCSDAEKVQLIAGDPAEKYPALLIPDSATEAEGHLEWTEELKGFSGSLTALCFSGLYDQQPASRQPLKATTRRCVFDSGTLTCQ